MDITKRVNRLIGQLRGIERMVKSDRDCADVLQQISAVKKAIDGLSTELVIFSLKHHLSKEETEKIERLVERAISL